jgi:hypothetical protein
MMVLKDVATAILATRSSGKQPQRPRQQPGAHTHAQTDQKQFQHNLSNTTRGKAGMLARSNATRWTQHVPR